MTKSTRATRRISLLLVFAMVLTGLCGLVVPAYAESPKTQAEAGTVTTNYVDENGKTLLQQNISQGGEKHTTPIDSYIYVGYDEEVTHVYSRNHLQYIIGYPDGSVGPERELQRSEAAMIFYRLYKYRIGGEFTEDNWTLGKSKWMTDKTFSDVKVGSWYYDAIEALYNMGVVEGIGGGKFAPDKSITRAELATMAARYDNLNWIGDTNAFSDVPKGHWAMPTINAAAEKGWVVGYGDGTFRPDNNISRAETVTLINRVLEQQITVEELKELGVECPYNDIKTTHWAYADFMEATIKHDTVGWHGSEYHKDGVNYVVERFVDENGKEIKEAVTTEAATEKHPREVEDYEYWGYVKNITYKYQYGVPKQSITKNVDKNKAEVGDILTYTIEVTNSAEATGTWKNVVVTDEIPEELEFVDGSVYRGKKTQAYKFEKGILRIELGDIKIGETVEITFKAKVGKSAFGTTVYNTAVAEGDNGNTDSGDGNGGTDTDGDGDGNTDGESPGTDVGQGKVIPSVKKESRADTIKVGDTLTYDVYLSNDKTADFAWQSVIMTDEIPEDLVFVSGSVYLDDAFYNDYSFKKGVLTVNVGDIKVGETKKVTFSTIVRETAYGKTIKNSVTANGGNTDTEQGGTDGGTEVSKGDAIPSLSKTSNKSKAEVGDIITYTITAANDKNADVAWENVIISDDLPTGVDFQGSVMVNGKNYTKFGIMNGLLSIDLGDIAPGETKKVTFDVKVGNDAYGSSLVNEVTALSDNHDDLTTSDTGGVDVGQGIVDPSIKKTVANGITEASVGETKTYLITLTNSKYATFPWRDVVLEDKIPSDMQFVSGSVYINDKMFGGFTFNGGVLSLPIGDIAPGETVAVTFDATVKESAYGKTIYNTAVAKSENAEDVSDKDNGINVGDGIVRPVLRKSVDKATANVGDTLTYTITVENENVATAPWENIVLKDTLPSEVEFITGSIQINGSTAGVDSNYDSAKHELGVRIGKLDPGAKAIVTFRAKITDGYGTSFKNSVVASSSNNENLETSDGGTLVSDGDTDLQVTKTSNTTKANIGDTITYTVTVANGSKSTVPIEDVTILDIIPEELSYQPGTLTVNGSTSNNLGVSTSYDAEKNTVRLHFDVVPVNTLFTVKFDCTVRSTAKDGQPIRNTLSVDGPGGNIEIVDPNPPITDSKDVNGTIEKSVDKSMAAVGDILKYTVKVKNISATGWWNGVKLTDTLPKGLELYGTPSLSKNGGAATTPSLSYISSSHSFTLNIGDLAPSDEYILTYQMKVKDGMWGEFVRNHVKAESTNFTSVEDEDNGTEISWGTPSAAVTKTSNAASLEYGEDVTYTIKIENKSTAKGPWRNVAFSDTLPAGLNLQGAACTDTNIPVSTVGNTVYASLGTLNPGDSYTITVVAKALVVTADTKVYNTAYADGDGHSSQGTDGGVTIKKPDDSGNGNGGNGDPDSKLQVSKTVNKTGDVVIGDIVEYTIKVKNNSEAPIYTIKLYDGLVLDLQKPLLASVKMDNISLEYGALKDYYFTDDETMVVNVGDMLPGEETVVRFSVRVTSDNTDNSTKTNYLWNEVVAKGCTVASQEPDLIAKASTDRLKIVNDPNKKTSEKHTYLFNGFVCSQDIIDDYGIDQNYLGKVIFHPDRNMSNMEAMLMAYRIRHSANTTDNGYGPFGGDLPDGWYESPNGQKISKQPEYLAALRFWKSYGFVTVIYHPEHGWDFDKYFGALDAEGGFVNSLIGYYGFSLPGVGDNSTAPVTRRAVAQGMCIAQGRVSNNNLDTGSVIKRAYADRKDFGSFANYIDEVSNSHTWLPTSVDGLAKNGEYWLERFSAGGMD